jgi:hypothetical protein
VQEPHTPSVSLSLHTLQRNFNQIWSASGTLSEESWRELVYWWRGGLNSCRQKSRPWVVGGVAMVDGHVINKFWQPIHLIKTTIPQHIHNSNQRSTQQTLTHQLKPSSSAVVSTLLSMLSDHTGCTIGIAVLVVDVLVDWVVVLRGNLCFLGC